jgi:hypothetical protein
MDRIGKMGIVFYARAIPPQQKKFYQKVQNSPCVANLFCRKNPVFFASELDNGYHH